MNDIELKNCINNRILLIQKLLLQKKLKILIWGYGLTGKSFLSWSMKFLSSDNSYIIIDKKNLNEVNNQNVIFVSEKEIAYYQDIVDIILPSPGIFLDRNANWYPKIIPEFDLFFYFWNKFKFNSILITGSVGKTSTTTMIDYYMSKFTSTILCGNIGFPILDYLYIDKKSYSNWNIIAIIEGSNAQLEHSLLVSPSYFIITNLYKNHLNIHSSYQEYIKAKLSPLISNFDSIKKIIIDKVAQLELITYFLEIYENNKNKIIIVDNYEMNNIPEISFPNNWKVVSLLLDFFGKLQSNFYELYPLPLLPNFRLEKIYDKNRIVIFNDSKSTIIESSLSALFKIKKNYQKSILFTIIGGLSKGVCRLDGLNSLINHTNQLIIIGTEKFLYDRIKQNQNCILNYFLHLNDAILFIKETIFEKYKNNEVVILFSPGGASFDFYESYIDRGNKFNILIKENFI